MSARFREDAAHITVCELGSVISFALEARGAAAHASVRHVLGWRAKQEMIRVDAGWYVAAMTDERVSRYRTNMHRVRHPMRTHVAPIVPRNSIAILVDTAEPQPAAGIGFRH
jgi:hypothetical protein